MDRTIEPARLFELVRDHDVSGVSGTGIVAQGVQWSDGTVVMRWLGELGSTVIHDSIDNAVAIHGHGGATTVRWLDLADQNRNSQRSGLTGGKGKGRGGKGSDTPCPWRPGWDRPLGMRLPGDPQ